MFSGIEVAYWVGSGDTHFLVFTAARNQLHTDISINWLRSAGLLCHRPASADQAGKSQVSTRAVERKQKEATTVVSGKQRIRVLILEDNTVVLDRLHRIFNDWDRGHVIGCHSCLSDALATLETTRVDLLLADLHLGDGNGIRAIEEISVRWPQGYSIVVSALSDRAVVIDALKAGAIGYILKDDDSLGIIEAVEAALEGQSPISIGIARHLVDVVKGVGVPAKKSGEDLGVTDREIEILNAIAKGFTNREISEILGISANTVPVHIRNIYRKLHASNRSEATFEAHRFGLLER